MSEDLLRIVYFSTASSDFSDEELGDLLAVSRRNNLRDGVTGALAYHDHTFFQVLEGPEAVVEAIFARIKRDPRHKGILVPDRSRVRERIFGDWSMGWMKASDLTRMGFDPDLVASRTTQDAMVDAMLRAFRQVVRVE